MTSLELLNSTNLIKVIETTSYMPLDKWVLILQPPDYQLVVETT